MSSRLRRGSETEGVYPFADALHQGLSKGPARKSGRVIKATDPVSVAKEEGRQKGYDIGYALGVADGTREAITQGEQKMLVAAKNFSAELEVILGSIQVAMSEWFALAEESLAPLSISIAEQILLQELEANPDSIMPLVRHAVSEIQNAAAAKIKVNIAHLETVCAHRHVLYEVAPALKSIEIVADQTIRSGCIVETSAGSLDASLDTAIENLNGWRLADGSWQSEVGGSQSGDGDWQSGRDSDPSRSLNITEEAA